MRYCTTLQPTSHASTIIVTQILHCSQQPFYRLWLRECVWDTKYHNYTDGMKWTSISCTQIKTSDSEFDKPHLLNASNNWNKCDKMPNAASWPKTKFDPGSHFITFQTMQWCSVMKSKTGVVVINLTLDCGSRVVFPLTQPEPSIS